MTDYVILVCSKVEPGEGTEWKQLGTVQARSAKAAIRDRIDGAAQSSQHYGDGEYKAVPLRNWQSFVVKTETKTQLRFS